MESYRDFARVYDEFMDQTPYDEWFLNILNIFKEYKIDKDAQVTPYLTKNIVKLQDLTAGTSCLLWEDENGIVTKVMIFA